MKISQDNSLMESRDWVEKWHIAPSNSKSFEFLDGIRGLAILLVVFAHLFYINPKAGGIVKMVGSTLAAGTLGVTVFFTLSGFLISLPFWKCKLQGRSFLLRGYFSRRFWKIYPPLALSVVVLLPFYIWIYGWDWQFARTSAEWLTGIAWVIPVSGKLNPVMWSLIVEVHFYLLLPLAFFAFRTIGYRTTLWLIFLILLFVPLGARMWYASRGMEFALHPMIYVNFPVKMDAFAAGVLIAGLYQRDSLHPRMALLGPLGIALLCLTLLLCGVSEVVPSIHEFWTVSARHYTTMLASACMLCFVAQPALAAKWGLSAHGLRWCGLVSYEWYLFHQPPHIWMRVIAGSAEGNIVKYLLITLMPLLGSLVVAAMVYRMYSLPILRRHRA